MRGTSCGSSRIAASFSLTNSASSSAPSNAGRASGRWWRAAAGPLVEVELAQLPARRRRPGRSRWCAGGRARCRWAGPGSAPRPVNRSVTLPARRCTPPRGRASAPSACQASAQAAHVGLGRGRQQVLEDERSPPVGKPSAGRPAGRTRSAPRRRAPCQAAQVDAVDDGQQPQRRLSRSSWPSLRGQGSRMVGCKPGRAATVNPLMSGSSVKLSNMRLHHRRRLLGRGRHLLHQVLEGPDAPPRDRRVAREPRADRIVDHAEVADHQLLAGAHPAARRRRRRRWPWPGRARGDGPWLGKAEER